MTPSTRNLFIDVTGTDVHAINIALNVLCTSLADRNANIETITVKNVTDGNITTPDLKPKIKIMSIEYVYKVLGIKIDEKVIVESLQRMHYGCKLNNDKIEVKIPCYRSDILHDIDIVEDIAIGYGYENIPAELPRAYTFGKTREFEKFISKIETFMIGLKFNETFTSVLSNENEQFVKMNRMITERVEILNPINQEATCVRVSILPSLIKILSDNQHHELPQMLFEIGDVIPIDKNEKRLGLVVMHSKAGFTECKSIIESILKYIHEDYNIIQNVHESFIDGRCASILYQKKELGYFGEIHPQVLHNFGLSYPVIVAELDVEKLFNNV